MKYLIVLLALVLAACVQDGDILTIRTADPNVSIAFKLLPAPPPLPTVTPQVVPCLEIKGNINAQGEKIAHSPGQANYDTVVISPERGEKLFCTLEDAIAAGWRPSQR